MTTKSAEAFRTISEAADELDLPQHVLRFWETRFSQIKPLKRGGGRRYYRPEDVSLLKGIRHLLYDKGFTIKGVQRILKEQGARHVIDFVQAPEAYLDVEAPLQIPEKIAASSSAGSHVDKAKMTELVRELLECKRLLDGARE